MGELKDVFLSLPEEEKEALMDNYGYSIARDIEAGIMSDWWVVVKTAVEESGILRELREIKKGRRSCDDASLEG